MINQVHKQITSELQQNTKTDTIFIVAAILLNLLTLAINSSLANQSREKESMLVAMFLFVALIILVNTVVIIGLLKGKLTRQKLVDGLMKMYQDHQVDKYYDQSLLTNYNTRYNLFIMVVVFTGIVAVLVPFVVR